MNVTRVSSGGAFAAKADYCRTAVAGGFVHVAGTVGAWEILEEQCKSALTTIRAALEKAGSSFAQAVRVNYYSTDAAEFEPCRPILANAFGENPPVATMIECTLIDPKFRIEIEWTALAPVAGGPWKAGRTWSGPVLSEDMFWESVPLEFQVKTIGTKSILYVMAVDAEYQEQLRKRIDPLMTGVGPVEAAVVLTSALTRLEIEGRKPDLVVSLGSAGSARLEQTEVYQAISVSYRDMDASPLGFEKGTTPFLDLPAVVPLPHRVPGVAEASLSTGANIVSGATYDSIDADMVDMESFAVLRACSWHRVPMIGLRGISDGKEELKHVNDWREYLHIVDENLGRAVERVEAAVADGHL